MNKPRILFFGSPAFAATILDRLLQDADYLIVGAVTQPDKPKGRKQLLTPPEVKILALEHGLEVYQPTSLKSEEAQERIRAFKPDLCVVASYGKILPKAVLDIPEHGCINVHASILPKYRGASPIQAAIKAGELRTGITTMLMDEGLDTGDMILQSHVAIDKNDTAGTLSEKLADQGAFLIIETIDGYLSGEYGAEPQDHDKATVTHILKKEDGRIDWSWSDAEIERHIRAMTPWPGAFFDWNDLRLQIKKAHLEEGQLVIDRIQPAGKNEMDFSSFLQGHPDFSFDALRN